jgi:hypothetical protein
VGMILKAISLMIKIDYWNRVSWNQNNHQGYIWWYSVCWKWHWSDTQLLIHDKKNEYGTVQFALIEGIGKIKINQSVENELILEALMIILIILVKKLDYVYIIFYICYNEKQSKTREL